MFKVGDWVRNSEGYLFQVSNDNIFASDDFTLWQPKEGEWFWYNKRLAKIVSEHRIEFSDGCELVVYGNLLDGEEVEPFIGELPSFIKEKQDGN